MNTRVAQGFDEEYVAERGPHFVPSTSRFDVDRFMQSIRNFATVSEALRVLGAAVLLASMSLFLMQGWNDGNDVRRYLMLLTQTGLLAVAGFALSHGLKEAKGARLFFGLALVSIPANFTILGALLYSVFQWDSALTTYPAYATWQIENVASTGITLAGAMVVLLPVALFCFAIMARHSAKTLSVHFFALNLMLLLPIRSSLAAGTVALLGTVYALYIVKRAIGKDRALKTVEGKFALTTLFIPAGIILFRSMYFYQVDSLLIAMLSLAAFLAARQASTFPERSPRVALGLELLSLPLAVTFASAMTDSFAPVLAWALTPPLFALAYTVLALDVLRRTENGRLSKGIAVSISLIVSSSFVLNVAAEPGALTAFLCLIAGALMFLAGVTLRNRTASVAGALSMIASVLFGFDALLALVLASSWIDLAIFGACAIAMGSILDRHGVAINLRLANWFGAIRGRRRGIALDD
ncbi:MAG: hypothetical protein GY783_11295 [Gammaproteobacteria bacterium]|nr:hypothetical protein [Gammaproteobacteria bacterium]